MVRRYKLKIIDGPAGIGDEFIMKEGSIYELSRAGVSRNTNNEVIYIEDQEVSKLHCVVRVLPGELIVEDKGSTNGTFVNGMKVEQAVLLGDYHLRIGNTEFVVLPVDSTGAILFRNSGVYSKEANDFFKAVKLLGDSLLLDIPENLGFKNKILKKLHSKTSKLGSTDSIIRPVVPSIDTYHFQISLENKKTGSIRTYELYRKDIIIGRDLAPNEGLIALDKGVSKKHVKITVIHNRQFKIEDLNSSNGLFVNNLRVNKAILKSEDSFLMSLTVVTLKFLDDILL